MRGDNGKDVVKEKHGGRLYGWAVAPAPAGEPWRPADAPTPAL